jgi:hypothetical protein
MLKTTLLACPYPLIIAETKPFLDQNSFAAKRLDSVVSISASESHHNLGKQNTLLYLSMGDLSIPKRREFAFNMVQRHFS